MCAAVRGDCKKILERQSEERKTGGEEMCDRGGRGDDSEGDGESKRRVIKKE